MMNTIYIKGVLVNVICDRCNGNGQEIVNNCSVGCSGCVGKGYVTKEITLEELKILLSET